MKFGVNTWVWTAPLTTEELEVLAPKIAKMGFDHIEIPIDDPKTLDFKKCGEIIKKAGISSISVCAAMSPDRDLIDPDLKVRQNGVDYLKPVLMVLPWSEARISLDLFTPQLGVPGSNQLRNGNTI